MREALTIEPAEVALEQFVRAYFRYLPPALEVLTALDAAAITDEAARAAWQSRKQVMHDMLSVIIRRLADSGRLQSSWSVARAADWGLVMLHPATWAELVGARGWSARSVTEHVVDALKRELLA